MSGLIMPIISSNKMLQRKRERDQTNTNPSHNTISISISNQMKKCLNCHLQLYHTMMQKCAKCDHSFCSFCRIKQSSTNSLGNWACIICDYINEEQYKIDLNLLEDEVKGRLSSANWNKCSACNIETDIKYMFSNSNDLYQFLNVKGLVTESNLRLFNKHKPVLFQAAIHLCDACIYYLLTPPYGNINTLMKFFLPILAPKAKEEEGDDEGRGKDEEETQMMKESNLNFYEYSTGAKTRNTTSESKKTIGCKKLFGVSKGRVKKTLEFDTIQSKVIIGVPTEVNANANVNVNEEDNDDDSFDNNQLTRANSITSESRFTLLNQYPKNYNPLTFEYLQQIKYFEEIIQLQIQSFYSFIELNQYFTRSCHQYMNNSHFNCNCNCTNSYYNNQCPQVPNINLNLSMTNNNNPNHNPNQSYAYNPLDLSNNNNNN